jgi:hypothetical protein
MESSVQVIGLSSLTRTGDISEGFGRLLDLSLQKIFNLARDPASASTKHSNHNESNAAPSGHKPSRFSEAGYGIKF